MKESAESVTETKDRERRKEWFGMHARINARRQQQQVEEKGISNDSSRSSDSSGQKSRSLNKKSCCSQVQKKIRKRKNVKLLCSPKKKQIEKFEGQFAMNDNSLFRRE